MEIVLFLFVFTSLKVQNFDYLGVFFGVPEPFFVGEGGEGVRSWVQILPHPFIT